MHARQGVATPATIHYFRDVPGYLPTGTEPVRLPVYELKPCMNHDELSLPFKYNPSFLFLSSHREVPFVMSIQRTNLATDVSHPSSKMTRYLNIYFPLE